MGEPLQERRRDPGGNRVCDASGPPDSIGPVRAQERIVTLDILRGIALLGVLIANVYLWFNGLWFLFPEYGEELMRFSLDSVAFHGITAFVEGKAITTFSFLFGLGFALQMTRAEAKGGHALAPGRLRVRHGGVDGLPGRRVHRHRHTPGA